MDTEEHRVKLASSARSRPSLRPGRLGSMLRARPLAASALPLDGKGRSPCWSRTRLEEFRARRRLCGNKTAARSHGVAADSALNARPLDGQGGYAG
jgi:hypothetical protein